MIPFKRMTFNLQLLCSCTFLISILWTFDAYSEETGIVQETEEQQNPRTGFLDPELKKQEALAASLEEYEKVWLDVVYPESESPRNVLAIAKESLIAETQGAILLLHDKEQHADWPQIIRPVRMSLPKWGWYTLSVNLPDELRLQQPERELDAKAFDKVDLNESLKKNLDSGVRVRNETAKQETATSDDQAAEEQPQDQTADESVDINLAAASREERPKIPYNIRAISHIEKAMAYLRNQNYQNIVMLACRKSSELVLDYIKKHQAELTSPGFALIVIEPEIPDSYLRDLSKWVGTDFKPPILDIVDSDDMRADGKAELRKLAFERAGAQSYRQIFMPISNSKQFHESLSKRIRLWLDKAAPGMIRR